MFDVTIEATTDVFYSLTVQGYFSDGKISETPKRVKDCIISIVKPVIESKLKNNEEFNIANKISFNDWIAENIVGVKDVKYDFVENIITKAMDIIPNVIENCLPDEAKKKMFENLQTRTLYHILKNTSYLSTLFKAAGAHIGYSVGRKEVRENIEKEIERAKQKLTFLANRKNYYQTLIKANENNCLEYAKIINSLKVEISTLAFNKNEQEVLTLMGDYVLGKKEIPQYTILSSTK